jgi:hypothetical protein
LRHLNTRSVCQPKLARRVIAAPGFRAHTEE